MRNKIIKREDILTQYAPWLNKIDECSSDNSSGGVRETLPQSSLCKVVIMQCETLTSGYDNREREKLNEIFNDPENKHIYKEATINQFLNLRHLQLAQGDVFHFIGHSLSLVDGAGAIIVGENEDSANFLKLSDIDMSLYLGTSHSDTPLRLIYLSMCDKFSLACMLMSTLRSNGSFYVVCWNAEVPDKLVHDFSEQFYSYCAYTAFDIEKAFDTTVCNILLTHGYSEEERKGYYPCLFRQSDGDGHPPSLLRANWKQMPDEDIIARFNDLCARDLVSEAFGSTSEPFHMVDGDRCWLKGNTIGNNERGALDAMGFETRGHALTVDGRVADIDSFWGAQVNLDANLWPATAGKPRKWPQLWDEVLPQVILTCTDINKINACRRHLKTTIHLRSADFQQKRNNASLPPQEQRRRNRCHQHIIEVMKKAIQVIDGHMATIKIPVSSLLPPESAGGSSCRESNQNSNKASKTIMNTATITASRKKRR